MLRKGRFWHTCTHSGDSARSAFCFQICTEKSPVLEPKPIPQVFKNQCRNRYRNKSIKSSDIIFFDVRKHGNSFESNAFLRFRRLRARTEKVSNNHRKCFENTPTKVSKNNEQIQKRNSVDKSSQLGPWSAQWSKRCSGLVGEGRGLPPKGPP